MNILLSKVLTDESIRTPSQLTIEAVRTADLFAWAPDEGPVSE